MTLSARSRPRALDATAVPGRVPSRFVLRLHGRVMARWRELARSRALPAAVSIALAFERGERVLAVGRAPDDGYALVATHRALYHRDQADAGGWSRLGWEQIARVGWDTAGGQLVIVGLSGIAPPRTVVPLRDRGTIPELAQDRVTHSRLGRWHVLVAGTHRVLVEARRRPVTGETLWVVISDANGRDHGSGDGPGEDSGDVERHVERAIARLRADLGGTPWPDTGLPLTPPSVKAQTFPRSGSPASAAGG